MATSFISLIISIFELIKIIKSKIQLCLRKWKTNDDKVNKITTKEHKMEEQNIGENKNEENKLEENKPEENKHEINKQDGIFKPYSKIQLKNNKNLYVQEIEFSFEKEEQK